MDPATMGALIAAGIFVGLISVNVLENLRYRNKDLKSCETSFLGTLELRNVLQSNGSELNKEAHYSRPCGREIFREMTTNNVPRLDSHSAAPSLIVPLGAEKYLNMATNRNALISLKYTFRISFASARVCAPEYRCRERSVQVEIRIPKPDERWALTGNANKRYSYEQEDVEVLVTSIQG